MGGAGGPGAGDVAAGVFHGRGHPDVLATYVPWLSAIANSFQAGFWEEALFRAVPIAGAALIGERLGQRKLFIVLAFIVQAIIFGAGHAPYPNQPAYARPVELIIPSIGFGLLYLYFGLLPGIILHFAFDVVWFALPIFLAKAPGIWFQQLMVDRADAGAGVDRAVAANAGGPMDRAVASRAERRVDAAARARAAGRGAGGPAPGIPPGARTAWLGARRRRARRGRRRGRAAADNPYGSLPITRTQAENAARQELQKRGVDAGAEVARDGRARRRERRTAPVRVRDRRASSGGASCSACTCRSRAGACASRRSKATSRIARKSG